MSSEITASSGLIQNIMTSTPMTVKNGGDELGQALLERLGDVVDVVGDAAQDVAARTRGRSSASGSRASFWSTRCAEPVDGPLRDAGHDVALVHPRG